jgi:hypothetical protein
VLALEAEGHGDRAILARKLYTARQVIKNTPPHLKALEVTAVEHVRAKSLRLAATGEFANIGGFLTVA